MPDLLGFELYLGPEVPRPEYTGWTRGTADHDRWRRDWRARIEEAIRDEDAWGLLCTAPDGDVTLRDVLTEGAVWAATNAGFVHLLLGREARRPASDRAGRAV